MPWHDTILQFIAIDRQDSGLNDIVRLSIIWPDCSNVTVIEFYDCYGLIAHMNFGMVLSDTILTGECFIDSQELTHFRNLWAGMKVELNELKCFKITTNSTNSSISIFALGYKILGSNTIAYQMEAGSLIH